MAAIAARSVKEIHGNSNMSSLKDLSNDNANDNAATAKQKGDNVKKGDSKEQKNKNSTGNAANAQPLAPPPKPNQSGQTETPDYFNGSHSNSHFSLEPNPFEQSFGNPSTTDTPSKFAGLPSVASLTSPAPIGPGGTPSWQNSLRSGPLSPAMLPGPTPSNGYFDESFRGSFPTPNESSLRTGLTPGGGGSMFPAPSPGSQAIYNSLQSGGATPGTLDFHRSAMNAAARTKSESSQINSSSNSNNNNNNNNTNNNGSNGATNNAAMGPTPAGINKSDYQPAQQHSQSNPFANPSDSDAASSLFMLANNVNRNNQFAVPNQPQGGNNSQAHNSSPTAQRGKQSIGSMPGSTDFDGSDDAEDKATVGRGKAGKKGKGGQAANGRRKAEDAPSKQPANKKARSNSMAMDMSNEDPDEDDSEMDDDDMDESNVKAEGGNGPNSNKKMTDEEKRKNFLERNRVAALKCRQRKKQWLQNLQAKVEIFSTENEALNATCAQLRDEIHNLKTLLMAHKDCAVSHSQGLGGNAMAQVLGGGDFNQHGGGAGGAGGAGYAMMAGGGQMMQMQAGQGVQRR